MPLWSRRNVLATGSWLVLAMAPLASATPPALSLSPQPRTAEQRWERLKSQFPMTEPSGSKQKGPAPAPESFKRIPDDAVEPGRIPDDADTTLVAVPVESDEELPFPLLPSEPVWVVTSAQPDDQGPPLPVPVRPEEKQDVPAPEAAAAPKTLAPNTADAAESKSGTTEPGKRPGSLGLKPFGGLAVPVAPVQPSDPGVDGIDPPHLNAEVRVKTIQEVRVGGITVPDDELREFSRLEADRYHVTFGEQDFTPRAFAPSVALFEAPDLWYYRLYFQDSPLERYGHTYHPVIQTVVSPLRFGVQLVGLPYQMAIDPPWCMESGLGWLDPGENNPKLLYQIPWNTKAAIVEAGVVTGLFYLIP